MAETWPFVLSDDKTYPPCDGLATPCEMARSQAKENLPKLSPILYDTLGHLALMPYRELATPAEGKAAWQGVARLLIEATARASHRATDETTQRAHSRGKKTASAEEHRHVSPGHVYGLSGADVERPPSR